MSEMTANLKLPMIAAAQAQKHVTHNEALALVDLVVQLSVISNSTGIPPAEPAEGVRYIVPVGASGAFAGHDQKVAAFDAGIWRYLAPSEGWAAWVQSAGVMQVFSGGAWGSFSSVSGLGTDPATGGLAFQQEQTVLSETAHGAQSQFITKEEDLVLSGSSVDSTILIPNRAIVFCVSTRTVEAVSGASSYDCGLAAESGKFGGSLGIAVGSNNAGVIGPSAFYSDTPIRLKANGGAFTAGKVRIALHYFLPVVPQI
ncbi:DUF2793 domain-containing protein [Pseudovibrio sp. Tun.PSC04-5.I4]|uniref:DUF2793 domain-containing protein n=1 Tax=Pseudovibrio sp. Tun.PSC04-5.I4 TaxID=1798213 RepID=UPI00088A7784|nr:DUF2793 domain-containing protein [Pseudovibrio sp. Tun.PSC04-5.I4]SDR12559.1 Protein of unknown function [Pseudovibrio sp. Tun.PSC04-5.I4]